MNVAVLGCGPAGLMAAHAVLQAGHNPTIYSRKVKSPMFGAQFLQGRVAPYCSDPPPLNIAIAKIGTAEGYAKNVYGRRNAPTSWREYNGEVSGWSLHKTYDRLWDDYEDRIIDVGLDEEKIAVIREHHALVLSTVPAKAICVEPNLHGFTSQHIWILHGDASHLKEAAADTNVIYYNGVPEAEGGYDWYRYSQIENYVCWEFARAPTDHVGLEHFSLSEAHKPLSTNCDCWISQGKFVRLGRFGRWRKGILTHHAYIEAAGYARAL